MKTHLFLNQHSSKASLLVLLILLINHPLWAQTNRTYASSQTNKTSGICVGCDIKNPNNAIGNDIYSYSVLKIGLGVAGQVEQTLQFPDTSSKKIFIGIDTDAVPISLALLKTVTVETMNGTTSNNDLKIVNSTILKIGSQNEPSVIELTPTKPYDRVKITLNGGVLNLNEGLRIHYAYHPLETRIYAGSEVHSPDGQACSECVKNPQNAVGPNENDYSILKKNPNTSQNTGQTLLFSGSKSFTKVVIGIGTGSTPVPSNLLQLIQVKTVKELNQQQQNWLMNSTIVLKPDPQHPDRGTIEFQTQTPYDGVKLSLLSIDELRIYYAYQEDYPQFNSCIELPFDPYYYFSFNGNTNSNIPGFNLNSINNSAPTFKNETVCYQGLSSSLLHSLESPDIAPKLTTGDVAISFWASIDPSGTFPNTGRQPSLKVEAFGQIFQLFPDATQLGESSDPDAVSLSTQHGFHHYVIVLDHFPTEEACLYVDGMLGGPGDDDDPACSVWTQTARDLNKKIKITLDRTQLDEMVIYNRAFTREEVRALAYTYDKVRKNFTFNSILNSKPVERLFAEENFIVLPNPTMGQITLEGNFSMENANIIISNASGKEVFRSKFISKTLVLPAILPGGVYMVTLQTKDGKTLTRKTILTR